ncbi:hypothetical protein [Massilia scottii]|uniref:hypothetical protein n=1 Tax=Massilia scottii TaxID=3057166 RepID=UPI0027965E8F|nr:hypothetical protein [Massilia sp. CCM 9029]MDQ1833899.1 hypothetical protein [Massilia sp. CCM 9029]
MKTMRTMPSACPGLAAQGCACPCTASGSTLADVVTAAARSTARLLALSQATWSANITFPICANDLSMVA